MIYILTVHTLGKTFLAAVGALYSPEKLFFLMPGWDSLQDHVHLVSGLGRPRAAASERSWRTPAESERIGY